MFDSLGTPFIPWQVAQIWGTSSIACAPCAARGTRLLHSSMSENRVLIGKGSLS